MHKGIAIATLALALAACAKRAPDQLPPPPGSGAGTGVDGVAGDPYGGGGVNGANLPGSQADFVQNVASDRVLFDTDSYTLDDRARSILDTQAAWLQANPNASVTIEGHADERGTREYNLALGDRRANSAKNYLAARGIAAGRMTTISWGKERPEAAGSDEGAWAQNRRAVTVLPQ